MSGSSSVMTAGSSSAYFPSDADAHRSARDEVASMFRTSDQLSRLPVFLSECIRKKSAIESQLSSAVRTQLDETRLGLQMLSDATNMMHTMRANFHAIDQYCKDCKVRQKEAKETHTHIQRQSHTKTKCSYSESISNTHFCTYFCLFCTCLLVWCFAAFDSLLHFVFVWKMTML